MGLTGTRNMLSSTIRVCLRPKMAAIVRVKAKRRRFLVMLSMMKTNPPRRCRWREPSTLCRARFTHRPPMTHVCTADSSIIINMTILMWDRPAALRENASGKSRLVYMLNVVFKLTPIVHVPRPLGPVSCQNMFFVYIGNIEFNIPIFTFQVDLNCYCLIFFQLIQNVNLISPVLVKFSLNWPKIVYAWTYHILKFSARKFV